MFRIRTDFLVHANFYLTDFNFFSNMVAAIFVKSNMWSRRKEVFGKILKIKILKKLNFEDINLLIVDGKRTGMEP